MSIVNQLEKNKLILFGICNYLDRFTWDNSRETILAITDLKEELHHKYLNYTYAGEILFQGNVSSIEEICKMKFDYIIVTDYYNVDAINALLKSKGIPKDRVVMYDYYAQCIRKHTFYSVEEENQILFLLNKSNVRNVIDMDLLFTDRFRFSREYLPISFSQNMQVDAHAPFPNNDIFPIYNNVYRNIYKNFRDFYLKTYDVALFYDYRTFQGYLEAFDFAKDISNNIIFRFRLNSPELQKFVATVSSLGGG